MTRRTIHRRARRMLIATGLVCLLFGSDRPFAAAESLQQDALQRAERALEGMSPAERVGQLFLVGFYSDPSLEDPLGDVLELISERKLGGLVLQTGSGAFHNLPGQDLPARIAEINLTLQTAALDDGGSGAPLFIAVDHEGDGAPFSHLREGFTALPSQLAIGATWDPASAETVGRIAGLELSSVGVNLLLGPVLDVLEDPRLDTGGDIGTRVFGGHPEWVGRMGHAYVKGAKAGSEGRLATVAKHFPGHGGSDRNPDQRAGTVSKSIEALQQVELPPFAALTDPEAEFSSDALMTSHIRYSGFQGNILDVTPPVSFDKQVIDQLLGLPGFSFGAWRESGGLIVSDSLGVNAVKSYFDPRGERFNPREVARQAFVAGNDVLILSQFGLASRSGSVAWSVQLPNVQATMDFFVHEYGRDAAFRSRVDAAALRVLQRKALLHQDWSLAGLREGIDPSRVGSSEARASVEAIASRALIVLRDNARPTQGQRLVVVTPDLDADGDSALACKSERCGMPESEWRSLSQLGPTLIEAFLLRDFGPQGSGVVDPNALRSLSFCQLEAALSVSIGEAPPPAPSETEVEPGSGPTVSRFDCLPEEARQTVRSDLREADWIILAFGDLRSKEQVDVLNALFVRWLDQLELTQASLAALSFGRPYYLDATNLSRLDFYAAAMSKLPSSVEAAVEALMDPLWNQEPASALPITYEDAGLRLEARLQPDPARPLAVEIVEQEPRRLRLSVGPVLDLGGHPVADGSIVHVESVPATALRTAYVEAATRNGMAQLRLDMQQGGDVELLVSAAGAQGSISAQLPPSTPPAAGPIQGNPGQRVMPTDTTPSEKLGLEDLLLVLAGIVIAGALAAGGTARDPSESMRRALLAGCWGLAGYVAIGAIQAIRPEWLAPSSLDLGILALGGSLVCALLGLIQGRLSPGSRPARPGAAR